MQAAYWDECEKRGKWGAMARVGKRFGITDNAVMNALARLRRP